MKKFFRIILLVFVIIGLTACKTNKKNKGDSVEDLLDLFISSYNDKDVNKLLEVLPDFMKKEINYTQEEWKENIIKYYGEDLKVSYKITDKKKEDQDEIDTINAAIKLYFNSDEKVDECYELEGTITFKSSKKTNTDSLNDVHYCKINNKWYLLLD